MGGKHFLLVCAMLFCSATTAAQPQGNTQTNVPQTRFTCNGRPAGYYADVDTGCQVYHMCDGLGRQFSYTCPNTTLFQQRMLICDHWYMVNCSMSEKDYSANLLIGQRDKPFVSEEEMRLRTPRPDILSVPLNNNYYDGLKEAESKFPTHPGNSIVGIPDSISSANNNGLDSDKHNYRPPSSWSTGNGQNSNRRPQKPSFNQNTRYPNNQGSEFNHNIGNQGHINDGFNQQHDDGQDSEHRHEDSLTGAASQRPTPTVHSVPDDNIFVQTTPATTISHAALPSQEFLPPFAPSTTESNSEEFSLDVRMKKDDDRVIKFINRFDPNSPDSFKTSMTRTEIMNINQQLPAGQSSAEEDRTPRRNKNVGPGNDFNKLQNGDKGFVDNSRFNSVNQKPAPTEATIASSRVNHIPTPDTRLVPPKTDFSQQPLSATTEGPAVYYEWKWAGPALDLEAPKESNQTTNPSVQEKRNVSGQSPFSRVTRPPPTEMDAIPPTKNTEYNVSSYFVPDYVFPLDKAHPGYEDEEAETSFNVKVARPGRASYGENPLCPHCHPAYLNPGTCEPCIVKR